MRVETTVDGVRAAVRAARQDGRVVAFVPTMGALHEGHLSLVRLARERAAATGGEPFTVLSIFVNPTQFGPHEDYDAYPRDLGRDREAAEAAGVDLVFAPAAATMYPPGFRTRVSVDEISEPLCGRGRPGHFDGVALVVTKLLNVVAPDLTVFGRKDAQQALLIRRLAADLNLPGEIVLGETVREEDGLALSSRNAYLSAEDRAAAPAISRGLFAARGAWEHGERDPERLREIVRREIDAAGRLEAEYVELVDRQGLAPWAGRGPALLAVAVRAGGTRLIDNVWLGEDDGPGKPRAGSAARPGEGAG